MRRSRRGIQGGQLQYNKVEQGWVRKLMWWNVEEKWQLEDSCEHSEEHGMGGKMCRRRELSVSALNLNTTIMSWSEQEGWQEARV